MIVCKCGSLSIGVHRVLVNEQSITLPHEAQREQENGTNTPLLEAACASSGCCTVDPRLGALNQTLCHSSRGYVQSGVAGARSPVTAQGTFLPLTGFWGLQAVTGSPGLVAASLQSLPPCHMALSLHVPAFTWLFSCKDISPIESGACPTPV